MKKEVQIAFFVVSMAALAVGVYYGARFYRQLLLLKQMCVKVRTVNIANIGLRNTVLNFTLGIKNKSQIDIQVQSINLQAKVNGITVSQINQSVNQSIAPQAWSDVAFDIAFNPSEVLKAVFGGNILAALSDYSKINIDIAGTISANINGVPINNFQVSINKTLADLLTPKTSDNDCS